MMRTYWITFRSLTHGQKASRSLERKGFTATLTRLPQGISTKDCGYAVIVRKNALVAIRFLQAEKIPYGQLFERNEAGEFREVIQ